MNNIHFYSVENVSNMYTELEIYVIFARHPHMIGRINGFNALILMFDLSMFKTFKINV